MLDRRRFIKASVTAAAGALLASSSSMAFGKATDKIDKVGLQLWSIAKNIEQDFQGSMELVSKTGYREVELFGPFPFSTEKDKTTWESITKMVGFSQSGFFNHTVKEFKKKLDGLGLSVPSIHIGLDTLRNKLGETAEAAHILGQQYAGIASIPQEYRQTLDDYKKMADEFNLIGEKAKALGIQFFYHNHGYGFRQMEGKIPFDVILERTDPSLVFFEMDIFWTIAGGADPIKYFDANKGRYKLMHVKGMKKQVQFSGDGGNPQQWVELFPNITDAGSGVLDLQNILTHAQKSGVDHFIVENDVVTNAKESLEKGYRFLTKTFH